MADVHGWRLPGLVTTALGGVLVLVSFTALDWYDGNVIGSPLTFSGLHGTLDALRRPAFSQIYFDWLAWLSFAVALVLALAANRRRRPPRLPIVAAACGLTATVLTLVALWSFFAYANNSGSPDVGVFEHTSVGLYLALIGFVAIGAGPLAAR